ncbi:unnamed protein product [Protopolystoma xenopodis]|uniref:Ig-like domain-containing protein n=1 Tax=Protopolystoma xenopodis TaxID=117903 RepID=A0A3S5ATC8_9PLAT|nr:unnamed protein product [Protopolystoma xenopodis]
MILDETSEFVGSEIDIEINPRQIYIRDGDRLNTSCHTNDPHRYGTEWYRRLPNGQEVIIVTGALLLIPSVSQSQLQNSEIFCRAREHYTDQIVGEPEQLNLIWESGRSMHHIYFAFL